jgi:hypothetical protein
MSFDFMLVTREATKWDNLHAVSEPNEAYSPAVFYTNLGKKGQSKSWHSTTHLHRSIAT